MNSFLRNVLANIVAIFIIGAIFFGFIMLFAIIGSMADGKKAHVKDNSVLTLDYKTNIIDAAYEDQEDFFSFAQENKNVMVYDMVEAIKKAKTDDRIKGISIENDLISAGITQLDAVRRALEDFKKSGKFIYGYGNTVSQSSYYLGSVADNYYLNPTGGIELKGLATELLYMKSFADKYGIDLEVVRHGKYKSAVEPYMRDDMSPENKEQLSTMLNDIWSVNAGKMAVSRKIDSATFRTVVDSLYGIIPDLAVQHNLADKLIQKSEYENLIKTKLKIDAKKDLNKISFSNYISSYQKKNTSSKHHVAVLYASGAILNGEGYDAVYARNFVKEIKKLKENDQVKAVVFRVNSPGGSANASDEILFELQQLKAKKPLVVSFGDYAASGGYYIAMGADKIFSEQNTITGSIGVFGVLPNVKELASKNGLNAHAVTTNANSNYYSPINGLSDGGRSMMTRSVEQTYKRFVHHVTQNRKKSFQQIDEVGGGRVWTGTRAKMIGLVDEIGSLSDAVAFAAQKAKMKDYEVASYPKKLSKFEQLFKVDDEEISAKLIKKQMGAENYQLFKQITDPKNKPAIMMELPVKLRF